VRRSPSLTICGILDAWQLVVKPVQNRGVDERNRRDQEVLQSRNDPAASLHDKMGQVGPALLPGL